jgi:hypothetical protein
MLGQAAMYILSLFVIILGGISLFIQKVYVDKDDGGKTVVELPFLGRLTTNYPALAFAFVGAAMAIYTFSRTSLGGVETWWVDGSFKGPSQIGDWRDGLLSIEPKQLESNIMPDGTFVIHGIIEKGKTFEDMVKQITYIKGPYIGRINVNEEYANYRKKRPTCLREPDSPNSLRRSYNPVEVTGIP